MKREDRQGLQVGAGCRHQGGGDVLAQRRKGKTYTASVMAEEMVEAGIPWVAIDPTGAWWGLRASANGKSEGLPVTIIGGDHGDVPLERTAGEVVADLVIENPGWYVLDLSHFESKGARGSSPPTSRSASTGARTRTARPCTCSSMRPTCSSRSSRPPATSGCWARSRRSSERGGIRGIGVTLISQRAASLNKNVLEQIDIYIVLRTVGAERSEGDQGLRGCSRDPGGARSPDGFTGFT
jgi:hypothetical protein